MSGGDGTKAAIVDAVRDAAAAEKLRAQQLELLPTRFAPSADDSRHADLVEAVKRDRGRPAGAENKATREVKNFVRRVFGDPMVERARWMLHTPETLAAELGCSKAEAFDRLDKIRADLSTFFYGRMAPVDGDGNAVPPQFNVLIGGQSTAGDQARPPWLYGEEVQQNQALPKPAAPVSHGEMSHEDDK